MFYWEKNPGGSQEASFHEYFEFFFCILSSFFLKKHSIKLCKLQDPQNVDLSLTMRTSMCFPKEDGRQQKYKGIKFWPPLLQ